MIRHIYDDAWVLDTPGTTYAFSVLPTGQCEHLYYGRHIRLDGAEGSLDALSEKHAFAPGNTCVYDNDHWGYSLEDMRLEMSSYGKGDLRDPFVDIVFEDGSSTCDFVFEKYVIDDAEPYSDTLPVSYSESGRCEHLCVTMKEKVKGVRLHLHYYVYEDCDCICRMSVLENTSDSGIVLRKLMSNQLDFDLPGYVFTSFGGAWAREMQKSSVLLGRGKHVSSSRSGESSHRANPFVMLHPADTTEDHGDVYGFNLIYSGNHSESAEVSPFGKTRFLSGINPDGFEFRIGPGEKFEAPEAVMTYSASGFNGMSGNMHEFVREHIVRGEWKKKERPVLLNSWEAAYFDINESVLVKLAKAGRDAGMELFVMDDGWFGARNDDHSSLGDWDVNKKKLPGGLKSLADKITGLGMGFGIWVEPEMVCTESELYRAHPDWSIDIPGRDHSEGRTQRILDLTNPAVCDFIADKMSEVFSSADISYVKWDMNRTFTDVYSKYLPAERQGEVFHRYICGLYSVMKKLTEKFPHILFEGCASGGNRFDLGILSYFPQIWASDDTDPVCRAAIQTGYSYGYPMSAVSAHVSASPNHQTLRETSLETRFNVAAFGVFGYECNLCDMKKEDLAAIRAQVELYKKWRSVLQFGRFYRGRSGGYLPVNGVSADLSSAGNLTEWTVVSEDREKAVGFLMQKLVVPNSQFHTYHARGLAGNDTYHFYNRMLKIDVREFGDLVNTVSPIHLKQDGLLVDVIAKFVKMDTECEDLRASGDTLMYPGVHLKQAFGGTGFNSEVRHFPDFASRIYFMERES